MTQQNEVLLILDALDQVICDPLGRHSWRRLAILAYKCNNPKLVRTIWQRISAEVDQHGLAGFYRAIFFRHILGIKSELANAGRALEEITPIHIDRLMSYVNFEWGNIVGENQSSDELVKVMADANIPRIMEIAAQTILRNCEPIPLKIPEKIKRIAFYTPQLFNHKHPPTKMVFEHARLLQSAGFEIKIFSCQEQSIQDMREYLSNDGHLRIPPPETHFDNQVMFQSPIDIVRAQEQYSLSLRAQSILQLIDQFQPDLCFFVGHQSLLLTTLYQRYPVLALNVTSVAPSGDFDLWLSADIKAKEQASDSASRAYYHPFRTIPKEKLANIDRNSLSIASDAILLITVGTRLHQEIAGEWAQAMLDLCTRFPQIVWLNVGGDGEIPLALRSANLSNIRSMPYQANLQGIYACANIYVNPPRIGGGFSVAEAMAEGIPALAYRDTDGGRKLGSLAANNHEEFFAELVLLINDPDARELKGKQMQEIFEATINLNNSTPSLLSAIELAHSKFKLRNGAA